MNNRVAHDIVAAKNLVEVSKADIYLQEAEKTKVPFVRFLVDKGIIKEEDFYKHAADFFGVPLAVFSQADIKISVLNTIPESMARRHNMIVFDDNEKGIHVAMANPQDIEVLDTIQKKAGKPVVVYLASPNDLMNAFKRYHSGDIKATSYAKKKTDSKAKKGKEDSNAASGESSDEESVIKLVEQILEDAIFRNVSDVHIEPREKEIAVRFRIDGVLREVMTLPKSLKESIIARIKVLSDLKLDEHRLPQDGRFMIHNQYYKVAFRVSIIPIFDGEKIVLRLLNESAKVLQLEDLGFLENELSVLRRNISKPHGMILVTGPTGSGKTTTLYTILNILNLPGVNILTIEDPIEYRITRVNQSQVQPKIGFTFATGLRSILRQDPDIIMVGEIRDDETAEISVHSAMTGHLLLSTLHTNSAAGALPRLTEMNVPSFLVASITNLVIGQRLVRKLCPDCREEYTLAAKDIEELEKQLDFQTLLQILVDRAEIDSKKEKLTFYRAVGCKNCDNDGYQGRVGIYELLEITKEISQLLVKNASAPEISDFAIKSGMLTMLQDGFIKAKRGITSLEEVLRVTKE